MSTLVSALVLVACSGGSAAPIADGPVKVGVVSGNNQTVTANRTAPRLPADVVTQAVRLPNGSVALRVLDAMLPERAYAQTAVNGVAGVVVCSVAPDAKHALVPEVPCTNTGADGKAFFTFHHDSVAGTSKAEVRATVNGATVVSDSVVATVTAGPASPTYTFGPLPIASFPVVIPATSVLDQYGNAVAFRIVSDGRLAVQDTTTGSIGARTITAAPNAQAYYTVELRGANNVLVGHARYQVTANVLAVWMAAGTGLNP